MGNGFHPFSIMAHGNRYLREDGHMISLKTLHGVFLISIMTVVGAGCDKNSAFGTLVPELKALKQGAAREKDTPAVGCTSAMRTTMLWMGYPALRLPLNHVLTKIDNVYGIYQKDGTVVSRGIERLCVRGPYCLFYSISEPYALQVLHCYDDAVELYVGEAQIRQILSVFKIDENDFSPATKMLCNDGQLSALAPSFLFEDYDDASLKPRIGELASWSKKSSLWPSKRIVNFGRVRSPLPIRSVVTAANHSTEPIFIEKFEAMENAVCNVMARIGKANEKSVWKEVFNTGNKTRLSISPGESIDLLFILEPDNRHSGPFFDVIRMTPSDTSIPISFVLYGEITTDDENNETLTESN